MKMYGVFGVCFGIFAVLLFWHISVIDTKWKKSVLSAFYTSHNPQQTKEYESYGDAADSTTAALKQLQEVEYALQVFYASSP